MFTVLDDLSKQRTQELLKAEVNNPASKIGNAYASYLDLATVEARGLTPIMPWLDQIKALSSKAGLSRVSGQGRAQRRERPFPLPRGSG
jgi:putative endopeptidase